MLKWFRARAEGWAVVVLLSFTALGTLSTTAHALVCGDELSPVFIAGHGPDAHALAATQTRERPSHCVLCHWMQSFRAAGVRARCARERANSPASCVDSVSARSGAGWSRSS